MKYEIKSRFDGKTIFTAEIEYAADVSDAIRLGLATKAAVKSRADLSRADLGGADLRGADLRGADLGGADLSRADLGGADLRGADLGGADLSRADLRGADLGEQWIIQGATRSDGYAFFLQKLKDDKEPMVKAGCRYFTLAQAEQHWTTTRGKTPLGLETQTIVRSMVTLAHIRKLMP